MALNIFLVYIMVIYQYYLQYILYIRHVDLYRKAMWCIQEFDALYEVHREIIGSTWNNTFFLLSFTSLLGATIYYSKFQVEQILGKLREFITIDDDKKSCDLFQHLYISPNPYNNYYNRPDQNGYLPDENGQFPDQYGKYPEYTEFGTIRNRYINNMYTETESCERFICAMEVDYEATLK